jgi:2-methylcitrate dehydratase PrpD
LLAQVGGLLTAASLPVWSARRLAAATATVSPVTTRLAAYMSEAAGHSLPEEVVEKTKHHILDTLAAMVSGAELQPGLIAMKFARAHTGEQVATVVGSNVLCGAVEAALVNGMLAHSDETDDSHAPSHSHPGCAVVPAALAAGEQFGVSGTHFLRAVTLGYDVGPRVTRTLGGLPYQMETHRSMHSIAEDFGAAAAAGCAAGLNERQMRFVLDYAAQQAAGIAAWERDTEHVEKSLVFAGMPARNGVTAALLIQLGGTGVEDIFAGTDNFLLAFAPKANPEGLVDKLGERYEVTLTNIKKWTVGSPIQAPLDALELIMKKHPLKPDQVTKVTVRVATSEANTVNNRDMPDICLQHMVAVMLLDRTASFAAAHDKPRMQDPAVLRERAKVQLIGDEELEKLYPKRITILEVTLTDGTKLTERVEAVRGTSDNPMTRAEVTDKARDLMAPRLGMEKTVRLIDSILNLERTKNVRDLRPLLQTA